MHVMYLIDSLVGGGAERSLVAMAPHLIARGVELEVAYLKERAGLQAELAAAGVPLTCLDGSGGRAGWIARTTGLLRRRRPDLVHTTLFEADVAGRMAGTIAATPVVSSLVNVEYGPEQFDDPRLKSWRLRGAQFVDILSAKRVRRFHAITEAVADVMSARLRIPRERIDVVPRGRDERVLGAPGADRRTAARRMLGIAAGTPVVLAAARQEHQKGLDVLVEAFSEVRAAAPDAVLLLAGRDGNQTPQLRDLCERLHSDEQVRFLGIRDDVPDLICAADVFVAPSRWEGLGSVVLEAMALETPIVASDLPPVREVIAQGSTGLLVPPENRAALGGAILESLVNRDEAGSRARAARARFLERYTIGRITDEMVAFYERALNGAMDSTRAFHSERYSP